MACLPPFNRQLPSTLSDPSTLVRLGNCAGTVSPMHTPTLGTQPRAATGFTTTLPPKSVRGPRCCCCCCCCPRPAPRCTLPSPGPLFAFMGRCPSAHAALQRRCSRRYAYAHVRARRPSPQSSRGRVRARFSSYRPTCVLCHPLNGSGNAKQTKAGRVVRDAVSKTQLALPATRPPILGPTFTVTHPPALSPLISMHLLVLCR